MGSTKIKAVDMSAEAKKEKKAASKTAKKVSDSVKEQAKEEVKAKLPKKFRSKTYINLRSQVDRTKTYPIDQAVALVKRLSRRHHPTITADINYRETGVSHELTFPHVTGKKVRVAIADATLLTQIEKGNLDFDILLATPDMMKTLARHAKVLGPKGLMPNPKNKTITQNPEKRKQELENGKVQIRTEKKAPIFHVQIGNTTQPDQQLIDNLQTLIKVLNPTLITRLTLSSTMGPGVKVDLSQFATV
jgi:large subunit ribosomal protein L1